MIKYCFLIFSILTLGCGNYHPKHSKKNATPALNDSTIIIGLSRDILNDLQRHDYVSFSKKIHPQSGLRCSPYAFIDTSSDIILFPKDFSSPNKDTKRYNWGAYDGSGSEIQMTISAYFKKFVYDVDFAKAPEQQYDTFIGSGNSLNNLPTAYPECHFTESYFPGFKAELEGMDWRCLRLVYKKYGNRFYLVGIVHDEWTI